MTTFHRIKQGIWLLILAAVVLLSGCSITASGLHDHPGYAHIDSPYWWQADSEVNLSLGPTTLRAARWFTDVDQDPEVGVLLKELEGIRISVYEVTDNSEIFKKNIAQTQDNLNQEGWMPVLWVSEKEEDETTLMFMKANGDNIDGLVVLSLSADEAVFVNVIGNIQPASFEPLMAHVNQ
ncbi:DUF4252 domain-containing protein [Alteromonas sediminis]|uniref:DUF4252 domain-containing protein n=1 Tax=Alteromonas sediminis TaxID=2259342 RepID=A0A3N5XYY9_9ALTE|nr:DUF4252 domain-containing protein [Alteromonas sediminis]RPJ66457.1 DUF4252 domain-containing protein [Alteromonas sediminis]